MPIIAPRYVNGRAIEAAVRNVEREFSTQVARIVYSFKEDHTGDPSIYFRILVRDEFAPLDHLRELSQSISLRLMHEAAIDESGLGSYFSFRSVSEQEELKEPAWD